MRALRTPGRLSLPLAFEAGGNEHLPRLTLQTRAETPRPRPERTGRRANSASIKQTGGGHAGAHADDTRRAVQAS